MAASISHRQTSSNNHHCLRIIGVVMFIIGTVAGSEAREMTVLMRKEGLDSPIPIEAESNWKIKDLKWNIRQTLNPCGFGVTAFNLKYQSKDITNDDDMLLLSDLGICNESIIDLIITNKKLMDTKILDDNDIKQFMNLLQRNGKRNFDNFGWRLLYGYSRDGHFDDESFVKSKYENKPNIIYFIRTKGNNVFGGYSAKGWKITDYKINSLCVRNIVYNEDQDAFIFGIRLNNGYGLMISNVIPSMSRCATMSDMYDYLCMGKNVPTIGVSKKGHVYHNDPVDVYQGFPTKMHLLAGKYVEDIVDLEIFELVNFQHAHEESIESIVTKRPLSSFEQYSNGNQPLSKRSKVEMWMRNTAKLPWYIGNVTWKYLFEPILSSNLVWDLMH